MSDGVRVSKFNTGAFLLFMLLAVTLHFETITIAGVKISYIWKFLILALLVISVNKKKVWGGFSALLVLSIASILNADLLLDPVVAGVNVFNILVIPLAGIYIFSRSKEVLRKTIQAISVFIILSFIPYSLGIIESLSDGYNLANFGGDSGLVGLFANAHGASTALAGSLLVAVNLLLSQRKYRWWFLLLASAGALFLVQTYVRTGYLMLVVGLLAMIISNSKHVKRLYLLMIPAFVALFLLSEMQVLEVIQNRLFETGAYSDTNRAASSLGSGRIGIYATSLSIFSDYNLLQSIFGVGKVIQQESIYSRIGMRIGSHNGFLDLLLAHGIVGLSLFVFFLYKAIDLIRKAESSPEKTMAVSLCAAYISMCMTQGFNWIFMTVLFLISLGVLHISNSDKEQRSKDGSHE